MRAIWKGSISFSLVNIPIALYTAVRREELKFRLLRQSDLSPVNYKRVAEADGEEVPWDQIVKGYEYEKGRFVALKDEDFRRVDIEATQTVEIVDFVEFDEIDPMFFDKPYYLEPQKGGAKAYAMLRNALRKTGKVGIAKVVIKTRQHLAAVKPHKDALILELMHFEEELVEPDKLNFPKSEEASSKEIEMASHLIGTMTDQWHPEKYKDDYKSALLEMIEEKIQSGVKAPRQAPAKRDGREKVIDLVSVLQESLAQVEGGSRKKRRRSSAAKSKTRKAA